MAAANGGWQVGVRSRGAEPACMPLALGSIYRSGVRLAGAPWHQRAVGVTVAVRLGRDLQPEAVLPAVEILEEDDVALVLGAPSSLDPADLDLRSVEAYLAFDGQPVATACGANPAGDFRDLLAWLGQHASLRAGDVVTTGSCTGLLFAPEGARVQAHLKGIGLVELSF